MTKVKKGAHSKLLWKVVDMLGRGVTRVGAKVTLSWKEQSGPWRSKGDSSSKGPFPRP